MGIEFELKYRANPDQQQALLDRFAGRGRAITMETTYYDTPDRFLSARHITLRRRMENGVAVCTVKTPAANGARGEWDCLCEDIHTAIEKLFKAGAPEYLLLLTMATLEPTCGARFTRQAIDIETPDFSAELAIDRGVLLGGGREEPLCEVELELKSGDANAMIAYMAELAAQYGLVTEPHSKFRRAKRLAEGV